MPYREGFTRFQLDELLHPDLIDPVPAPASLLPQVSPPRPVLIFIIKKNSHFFCYLYRIVVPVLNERRSVPLALSEGRTLPGRSTFPPRSLPLLLTVDTVSPLFVVQNKIFLANFYFIFLLFQADPPEVEEQPPQFEPTPRDQVLQERVSLFYLTLIYFSFDTSLPVDSALRRVQGVVFRCGGDSVEGALSSKGGSFSSSCTKPRGSRLRSRTDGGAFGPTSSQAYPHHRPFAVASAEPRPCHPRGRFRPSSSSHLLSQPLHLRSLSAFSARGARRPISRLFL